MVRTGRLEPGASPSSQPPFHHWLLGPPHSLEVADATGRDDQPFRDQERPLQRQIRVAAQLAAGGDHPMVGKAGLTGLAEDIPDSACRPRAPSQSCHVAVSGDPTDGDPLDDRQDATAEGGVTDQR